MLLLGLKNTSLQTIPVNSLVNLGNVYRKYCKKVNGIQAFNTNGVGVSLNQSGIYHITATIVSSASAVGDLIFNLVENGTTILTSATETITTATTELRTLVLDYYVLVDTTCLLGQLTNQAKVITIQNVGAIAEVANVVFNVEKVV